MSMPPDSLKAFRILGRRPKQKEPWATAGWYWAEAPETVAQALADSPWWDEYQALIFPQAGGPALCVEFEPVKTKRWKVRPA